MPLLPVHRPVLISTYLRTTQCRRQKRYLKAQAFLLAGSVPAARRHLRYTIRHRRRQGLMIGPGCGFGAMVVDEFVFCPSSVAVEDIWGAAASSTINSESRIRFF